MNGEKKTCGDCKRCQDVVDSVGDCKADVPMWVRDLYNMHKVSADRPADRCQCFERNGTEPSFDEGDAITCENLIDHVVAIGSPDDYGEGD